MFAANVDDELRFHLDMRTQELVEAGMPTDAARAEALRQFGDLSHVERELHAIGDRRERIGRLEERRDIAVASATRCVASGDLPDSPWLLS